MNSSRNDKEAPSTETDRHISLLDGGINEEYGRDSMTTSNASLERCAEVTSSGSLTLDRALGIKGYPRGRIVEVFGPESSGKTTLALHSIAEVQARGGCAAFIDAEHALDAAYAAALGVDLKRLLIAKPSSGEEGLDITGTLVDSGALDLVVIDSVAALVPKAELRGKMGDQHLGLHARLMGRGVRRITAAASRSKTCVLFTNQLRDRIGTLFGSSDTTTGGKVLRFFSSIRLDVRRIAKVRIGQRTIGSRTRVTVVKNKLALPFQEAEFDIRWGIGIDHLGELLDLGKEYGIVIQEGSRHSFSGQELGQDREEAREQLRTKPEMLKSLSLQVSRAQSATKKELRTMDPPSNDLLKTWSLGQAS